MYLKSLQLTGFKSFGDRTRLELRPGVTVIVGPNGSGKSNLVDAVSWVMGTQSAKSLRTGKMEDVVFAGTATRQALNRAEVTLVFDNASRTLPLDLDEVSITRRLYRDGSSDYELNGVGCRLLDIAELLSDSGVGRHQHVIVGQGQIDSVLNSGPIEHRAVIEEAAGILKHRARKDRAIRRLERTDADLVRLHDLVSELSRQMRPLKRQAAAAEQRAELAARVRALRLFVGGERLRDLDQRFADLQAERSELDRAIADGDVELDELATALHILGAEAGEVGEALDRDSVSSGRLETILERLARIASVAQERQRAASARLEGADERRRDLVDERQDIEAQLAGVGQDRSRAETDSERHERRFRALEDEVRSLVDQETLTPEGALAVLRGEVRSLEAADMRDQRELDQVQRRIEVVTSQLMDETGEIERLNDEIRRVDADTSDHQEAYQKALSFRQAEQQRWEEVEAQHAEARLALAATQARLEAVSEAAGGLADPVARSQVEAMPGHLGSLAGLLDVPADLAAAADAALGPWTDAMVFSASPDLEAAVGKLKTGGRGGVGVVRPQQGTDCPARVVANATGVDALVDRLGSGARGDLASRLLGDVVVVEGWASAWAIVARHPTIRAVTPEGDLITSEGIRVAHPDGATPAMVETAEVEVERAETALARTASLLTSGRRDFDQARQLERQALEALEEAEARLSGATEALVRLGRSKANLGGELARLETRAAALTEAVGERAAALDRLRDQISALEGEEAERQRAWEEIEARRAAVEAERELARAAWQQAASDLRASTERLALLENRLRAVTQGLESELTEPVTEVELERLALIHTVARSAIDRIRQRLATLRERQAELRRRAGDAGRQRDAVRGRHESARGKLEGARRRLSEIELESTEARLRRENVAEGLRRDADADEAEALAAPRPAIEPDTETDDLLQLLEDLDARLRRLGPVNPLAAEEYADLAERHAFLTDQLADLEASRDEVRRVIGALDEEIQTRFTSAFDEVAAAYAEHFSVLFPGGTGRLALTDPGEPLTSGVELGAQPLGKKVNQLTLLSGGERSLAALAFLFAVFRARPSPFYILDEVEAALDDANLRRFLRLVHAFRGSAQLMVVTHQQQTMEAANVLYGVTMEPGGSSRVVRKELTALPAPPATDPSEAAVPA